MPSIEPQRRAHRFLTERLHSLQPFTRDQFKQVTGWSDKSFNTYWSKQFKSFVEPVGHDTYRVTESFRPYVQWRKFRQHVTQVRRVLTNYSPTVLENIIVYEFYMPLAHENALRTTLDALFYEDTLMARLTTISPVRLQQVFPRVAAQTDDDYFGGVCRFIEDKFGGYSIYHVDGRFRSGALLTHEGAAADHTRGQRYLIDETTAVVRFIFPCRPDEPAKVQFLFHELFVRSIIQLVNGEDAIWMVESGLHNRVHIWEAAEDDHDEE